MLYEIIFKLPTMKRMAILAAVVTLIIFSSCSGRGKVYHVYYLGGQSNMDGYGFVSELPAELNHPVEGVMIYHGNTAEDNAETDGRGIWNTLQPGHGVGFRSDGHADYYSDRFGVELSFAVELKVLDPAENIAIIKYSKGGTSIDTAAAGGAGCWFPDFNKGNGINQYDHFMATVKGALAVEDIDGDGRKDRLIPSGIIWMQGESDANNEYAASVYRKNLGIMIEKIRDAFKAPEMPVVIGRISESHRDIDSIVWTYGDVVRQAQADFVYEDGNAALVISTDNYKYSDPWHYNTEGFIDLGQQFAEAIVKLQGR